MAAGWFAASPGGFHPWSGLVGAADPLAGSAFAALAARGLSVLLSLNALLAVFNLVPLPPLDGAAVIDILLPPRFAGIMRRLGPAGSMLGLLLAWRVFPMWVGPIHAMLERLVGA